jgi:hypothetical protein
MLENSANVPGFSHPLNPQSNFYSYNWMNILRGSQSPGPQSGPALACPAIDYTCIFKRKSNKKTIKKYIEFYTYQ